MSGRFGPDPWADLRKATPARIALGRAGSGLPTRAVLEFSLAHARARDAVHAALDAERVTGRISAMGYETLAVESAAPDRATYLARPDLGRRLSARAAAALPRSKPSGVDLAFVVADGLSAAAVHAHAAGLLAAMASWISKAGWTTAPVAVARQARVALGDQIGEALAARAVVVLIGERPGLSAPDSLGVYLTFDPRPGRIDAERNCISNIQAAGLSCEEAAFKLAWLIGEAMRRRLSGVALKDESDLARLGGAAPSALT